MRHASTCAFAHSPSRPCSRCNNKHRQTHHAKMLCLHASVPKCLGSSPRRVPSSIRAGVNPPPPTRRVVALTLSHPLHKHSRHSARCAPMDSSRVLSLLLRVSESLPDLVTPHTNPPSPESSEKKPSSLNPTSATLPGPPDGIPLGYLQSYLPKYYIVCMSQKLMHPTRSAFTRPVIRPSISTSPPVAAHVSLGLSPFQAHAASRSRCLYTSTRLDRGWAITIVDASVRVAQPIPFRRSSLHGKAGNSLFPCFIG